MAQLTEAACLIDQGAMFPSRQGFRAADGSTVLVGFKPGACSIYFDDEPIYHFDLEGRWQRAFIGCDPNAPGAPANLAGVPGFHYLKALDTSTVRIFRVREGNEIKIRRNLMNFADVVEVNENVRNMALTLHRRIATGDLMPVNPPESGRNAGKAVSSDELLDFLDRVAKWDTNAWSRQKEKFEGYYGPLPMSPPGCPGPVIFQATLGDSGYQSGGFGGTHTTAPYIRNHDEFEKHVQQVLALWGRRLPQARGLYICGPDFINQPMPYVLDCLETIQNSILDSTVDQPGRVIDPISIPRKNDVYVMTHHLHLAAPTVEMLSEYKNRGLVHLTLAIDSADLSLLNALGRKWTDANLRSWIINAAEARLPISAVVLVGGGGIQQPDHLDQAASFLESLPWDSGTVIYLLDAAETRLDDAGNCSQPAISYSTASINELKTNLNEKMKARHVKSVQYTIEKEWQ